MFSRKPSTEFYDTLGVSPSASSDEIKRAYKKLAVKFHPDKPTGNAEKFKEISRAYKTLSDPDARARYDQGEMTMDMNMDMSEGAGDFFENIYDMFTGGRRSRSSNRVKNTEHVVSLSLEELFRGTKRKFRINRKVSCSSCDGTGSKSRVPATCPSCKGKGKNVKLIPMGGNAFTQQVVTCPNCAGSGKNPAASDKCEALHCSNGSVKKIEEITLEVPAGTEDNKTFAFEGKGNEEYGKIPGDFVVIIKEKQHNQFARIGNDLIFNTIISLDDALHGCTISVPSLAAAASEKDKSKRKIRIDLGKTVIKPNDFRKVTGLGMPNEDLTRGDLYIKFMVEFPTWEEANKSNEEGNKKYRENKKEFGCMKADEQVFSEEGVAEILERKKKMKEHRSGRERGNVFFEGMGNGAFSFPF